MQPVRALIEIVMLELRGGGVPVGCVIDFVEAADILDFDAPARALIMRQMRIHCMC